MKKSDTPTIGHWSFDARNFGGQGATETVAAEPWTS